MTWRERLEGERAELERSTEQLRQREQDLARRENERESMVSAAMKTRDKIRVALEARSKQSGDLVGATVTADPTNSEERFQARLHHRGHQLVFEVEATPDGGHAEAGHYPPNSIGFQIGQVRIEDFSDDFVAECVDKFLDGV